MADIDAGSRPRIGASSGNSSNAMPAGGERSSLPEGDSPDVDGAALSESSSGVAEGALRQEGDQQRRRWYREPAALISLLALVVSIASTILAQVTVWTDRDNQQRARLTAILQQVMDELAVPKQGSEYNAQIVELRLLGSEAEELMKEVDAAPYEQLVIALAFITTGDFDKALDIVERTESQAESVTDRVSVHRTMGQVYFQQGSFEEARDALSRASEDASSSDLTDEAKYRFEFENEYFWVQQEVSVKNCSQARDHTQRVQAKAASAPQVLAAAYQERARALEQQVAAACP